MKISLQSVVPIVTLFFLACTATQKDFEYIGAWTNGQDRLCNGAADRMEITLKRDRNSTWSDTFREWEESFAPRLKARGPKW